MSAHSDGPGNGSRFTVRLPCVTAVVDEGPRPTAPQSGSGSAGILVVDDNAEQLETLALLLSVHGHDVRTAPDGPSAISLALQERPEVVFLDIGLPGMDGFQVARRLREELGDNVLLVAVTGYTGDTDKQRARECGFDEYVVKPADPDVIVALASRLQKDARSVGR